jgi:hypothetical protein
VTTGRYPGFTVKLGAVNALARIATILPIRNAAEAQEINC